MRYLDLESMKVETAGNAGSAGGALVSLVGIKDSREFREAVLTQRDRVVGSQDLEDRADAAAPAPQDPAAIASPPETLAVLTEIRDTLARIETRLSERD